MEVLGPAARGFFSGVSELLKADEFITRVSVDLCDAKSNNTFSQRITSFRAYSVRC